MDLEYFKQTFHFSSEITTPLYAQLAAYIRIQIQAGVLKSGDQMLPENSIADILNVSRTTVRQAMNRLVEEGLLIRFRGKGSFIASQKMRRNINYLYNFTDDGQARVPGANGQRLFAPIMVSNPRATLVGRDSPGRAFRHPANRTNIRNRSGCTESGSCC